MGEIYCLYSTSDGVPRYVGQTEYSAEKRLRLHTTKALEKQPGGLYDWIREQWRGGAEVLAWRLQEDIISADLKMYEDYWMQQFDGLLNVQRTEVAPISSTEVGRRVIDQISESGRVGNS